MPAVCCCCGAEASTTRKTNHTERKGKKEIRRTLEIPYCATCNKHVDYLDTSTLGCLLWLIFIFATVGLGFIVYVIMNNRKKSKASETMLSPTCVNVDTAIDYTFSDGQHHIETECEPFIRAFVAANPGYQVDSPGKLQQIMNG